MELPYEAMRVFLQVARCGSFSGAGKALRRSQSAVSLQVAKLETCVGQRLLERSTKHVALTDAGRILLGYMGRTEALLDQARHELQDLDALARGRLSLCTSDTTGCYRLPAILQRYRAAHPGIEIEIRNATSPRTVEAVLELEVDMGIVTLRDLPAGLEARPLFARHDVLICHPGHRLARRKRMLLKDLEREPFILLDTRCSSRRLLDALCSEARVTLQIQMELSSIEVIKRFVRVDAGLSIVPAAAVAEEVANGQLACVELRDFERAPRTAMGVIRRRDRYVSRAARSFLHELETHFKGERRA